MAGKREQNKVAKCVKSSLLTILTVSGVIGGGVIGFILKSSKEK